MSALGIVVSVPPESSDVDHSADVVETRGNGRDAANNPNAEAQLNSILSVVPDAIITIDAKGTIASFSPAAERLFGYGAIEVIGRNVKMLMPAPYREEHDGYLAHHIATGEKKIIGIGRDVVAQRKDGSSFPIHLAVNEMVLDGVRMFTGIVHDLSQLRTVEATNRRLAQIVENSVNEIYVCDAQTYEVLDANWAARQNLGYTSEEAHKLKPWDFVEGLNTENIEELIEPLRTGALEFQVFDAVHRRKDGSTYPVNTQLQFMRTQTPPVFTAIVQDITDLKRQYEQLHLRERAIAELDVGVIITDAKQDDNPIVYANRAIETMSGYGLDEFMGRNPRFLQRDDRDQSALDQIRTAMAEGRSVQVRLRNYRKDGTRFIDEVSIAPVRDDDGNVTHFIGIQRDITASVEIEDRLRQSQKMEAIGQLTGGVAHDFNNLLTVIIGNNELLSNRLGDDARLRKLLDAASGAANRGATLTSQLLSFARQQPLDTKVIDLNDLVTSMQEMLQRTLGETIECRTNLAPDLGKALADPTQVHNAVLNLAINARDAMPDGGVLSIETSNVDLDADNAAARVDAEAGQYVRLSVRDTGTGMPPEVRARVFEPFFTTKEKGKGTGLGLSMVHGFAKQSGGHLEIYSELGHGTAISLYLPDANEAATTLTAQNNAPSSRIGAGGETVLVVEDDPGVRDITVARLEHLGYRIIEAENGQAALDVLASGEAIDLVLTDMVMPGGMTGADLIREVRAHHPSVKVVFTSGYAQDGQMPDDGTPWLRKPYKIDELDRTLRQLLDQQR